MTMDDHFCGRGSGCTLLATGGHCGVVLGVEEGPVSNNIIYLDPESQKLRWPEEKLNKVPGGYAIKDLYLDYNGSQDKGSECLLRYGEGEGGLRVAVKANSALLDIFKKTSRNTRHYNLNYT